MTLLFLVWVKSRKKERYIKKERCKIEALLILNLYK